MELTTSLQDKIQRLKDQRTELDRIWGDIKRNYDKELAGDNIFHIGQTERLVDAYTRFLFSRRLKQEKVFDIAPHGKEDILTAQAFENSLNYFFPRWLKKTAIEGAGFNSSLFGTCFGQVFPREEKIRVLNTENVWFNNDISDWDDLDEIYVEYQQMKLKDFIIRFPITTDISEAVGKTEVEKTDCKVGEYWEKVNEDFFCNRVVEINGHRFLIDSKKITYWMGSPFLYFSMYKRRNSLWGKSVGEKIKESENIQNRLLNMTTQYAARFTNPSMWYVPTLSISEDQMQNIRKGKSSAIYQVLGSNSIGYILPPNLPMSVFNVLNMFTQQIEQTGELLGVSLGYPGPGREPESSRRERFSLANEPIEYVGEKFENSFIQQAGEKVFLSMFQWFKRDTFIQIAGDEGREWLSLKRGGENSYDSKAKTLTINSKKKEFLEYKRDITIRPYRGQDVEMLKSLLQFLNTNLDNFIKNSLTSKIDYDKLVMETLKSFGVEINKVLKKEPSPEELPSEGPPSPPLGGPPTGLPPMGMAPVE